MFFTYNFRLITYDLQPNSPHILHRTHPKISSSFLLIKRLNLDLGGFIKMPDISGIDFLRSISNPPMVIFTTAYSEHAVQSFELDAIDYFLKPFSLPRFLKACNKALEQHQFRNNRSDASSSSVFIKSGYEQVRVALNDILYTESNGNYIDFILPDKKITSRLTMNEAEALLPAILFVRIHRSHVVAKKHITKIEKNSVWIKQTEIPIGANYINELQKLTM